MCSVKYRWLPGAGLGAPADAAAITLPRLGRGEWEGRSLGEASLCLCGGRRENS